MSSGLVYRLRQIPEQLRRTPLPIADVVPLIQQAADRIEELEAEVDDLKRWYSKKAKQRDKEKQDDVR